MNKWLVNFLKIGLEIGKATVPAIAVVEAAVKDIKAGGDKKKNVIDIVKASPAIAELIANKEICDEALFAQGVSRINDGYVDVMNALKQPPQP